MYESDHFNLHFEMSYNIKYILICNHISQYYYYNSDILILVLSND